MLTLILRLPLAVRFLVVMTLALVVVFVSAVAVTPGIVAVPILVPVVVLARARTVEQDQEAARTNGLHLSIDANRGLFQFKRGKADGFQLTVDFGLQHTGVVTGDQRTRLKTACQDVTAARGEIDDINLLAGQLLRVEIDQGTVNLKTRGRERPAVGERVGAALELADLQD